MSNPIPNLFKVPELKEKLLFTLLCLTGCSGSDEKSPAILCTTTLSADVVRNVAGDRSSRSSVRLP